jgi:hypothetical protein
MAEAQRCGAAMAPQLDPSGVSPAAVFGEGPAGVVETLDALVFIAILAFVVYLDLQDEFSLMVE